VPIQLITLDNFKAYLYITGKARRKPAAELLRIDGPTCANPQQNIRRGCSAEHQARTLSRTSGKKEDAWGTLTKTTKNKNNDNDNNKKQEKK
jgi:hypothetical protein